MSFSYNIIDKIFNKIATLADQEEALKDPWLAYRFAELNIPGTDFERCQKVACIKPYYAFDYAAFVSGANIKYCQEYACKETECAYYFAKDVPGADIEYCRKACESDLKWLKAFDKMIAKKVLA